MITVWTNGTIYTGQGQFAQAFAIKDDRFFAVGTEEEKQSGTEQESNEETSVTIEEKVFSVEEINTGIERTLQNICNGTLQVCLALSFLRILLRCYRLIPRAHLPCNTYNILRGRTEEYYIFMSESSFARSVHLFIADTIASSKLNLSSSDMACSVVPPFEHTILISSSGDLSL